CMQGMQFPLTF
nr:immunoglobulin light chain junction region [Macaca mulatta]